MVQGKKTTYNYKLKNIIQKVKPNDPYIQRIRCGQYKPTVVRITIDFKQDVSPQIFSLKPAGTYKYRTVFDVYPVQEKDPILAILKKEEEEPDAVQKLVAQVAEGQKRMEENREEADADQLEQILAGIESGTLVPVKPEVQPSHPSRLLRVNRPLSPRQRKSLRKRKQKQLPRDAPERWSS